MSKNIVYEIEIKNWDKHNKKSTKNMPYIMLSKRFFDDPKVRMLSGSGKLLYLFLLLTRGEHDTNLFVCSHDLCTMSAGGRGVHVANLLQHMQELQLLTYRKIALKRIEKNRKEKNRREVTAKAVTREPEKLKTPSAKNKSSLKTEQNIKLWEAYKDAYFLRYGVNPVRNAKVNRIISQLRERLGQEAEDVVRFYLSHTKNFYISKLHDISYCLSDAESLRTQWAKGVVVTDRKVREFTEKLDSEEKFQDQLRKAREYDRQKDQDDHQQFLLERGEL